MVRTRPLRRHRFNNASALSLDIRFEAFSGVNLLFVRAFLLIILPSASLPGLPFKAGGYGGQPSNPYRT
jgi:hypothetical protein